MSELTEFLLARVAEDEHRAGMNGGLEQAWSAVGDPRADQFHVGFSPARVLRECEAKRRIVGEHRIMPARQSQSAKFADGQPEWVDGCCAACTQGGEFGGCNPRTGELDYCETLLALASVYVDHPEFRDEWRVES